MASGAQIGPPNGGLGPPQFVLDPGDPGFGPTPLADPIPPLADFMLRYIAKQLPNTAHPVYTLTVSSVSGGSVFGSKPDQPNPNGYPYQWLVPYDVNRPPAVGDRAIVLHLPGQGDIPIGTLSQAPATSRALTNPATVKGDMMFASASGAPATVTRLPIGPAMSIVGTTDGILPSYQTMSTLLGSSHIVQGTASVNSGGTPITLTAIFTGYQSRAPDTFHVTLSGTNWLNGTHMAAQPFVTLAPTSATIKVPDIGGGWPIATYVVMWTATWI